MSTFKSYVTNGEGILGFPRVFFYAGAKSVISTLWQINDKASAMFMKYFYEYLRNGNNKVISLKKAKVRMLDTKYNHPYYWAPFILTGDYSSTLTIH